MFQHFEDLSQTQNKPLFHFWKPG